MSVCSLTIVAFWKCLCLKILQFQTLNFVADIVQWWAGANSALLSLFGSCIPQQFFLFYLIIFGLGLWLQLLYFSGLQGCFLCSYNLKCPTFFCFFFSVLLLPLRSGIKSFEPFCQIKKPRLYCKSVWTSVCFHTAIRRKNCLAYRARCDFANRQTRRCKSEWVTPGRFSLFSISQFLNECPWSTRTKSKGLDNDSCPEGFMWFATVPFSPWQRIQKNHDRD